MAMKPKNNTNLRRVKMKKDDMTMATWNVRTMLQPGKMKEIAIELEKFNIDVTALQEIRWTGKGCINKKDFSLIYSGHESERGKLGVGFLLSKKIVRSLLCYEAVSNRLCSIRLKGKFRNISIISAHAPTEEKSEEEKENFYLELSKICDKVPKYDVLIVMGDFNAQIGKESFMEKVAGKYTLHTSTNENGKFLGQFAANYNLNIRSTTFQHKRIHLGTWKNPRGGVNQIDHFLISTRHASSILDVRACRGPNCDSDHFLVKALFRQKISNVRKSNRLVRKRWDTDKLMEEENKTVFADTLKENLQTHPQKENLNEEWIVIRKVIQETADQVLGVKKQDRNNEWFDMECMEAIEKKNADRVVMLQRETRSTREKYNQSRKKANKICRQKKKNWLRNKVENMKELSENKEERKFYLAVKRMKNGFQPRAAGCKDKQGKIIGEEVKIMERWAEHFEELLSLERGSQSQNQNYDDLSQGNFVEDIEPPSYEDFEEAVRALKNNKAPGEDCITAELIKNSGELVLKRLYDLIFTTWEEEKIPDDWNVGLIIPLFKKGDRQECKNYRGITLLNSVYKLLSSLLTQKLKDFSERILTEYQCGFRPNRGTTDQIFVLRQTLEKCYEFDYDVHILFIDFKQAFDRVNRAKLFEALVEFNIPLKLIRLIKLTLLQTQAKVLLGNQTSRMIQFNAGVRQGDALSAILFNLVLHKAIRNIVPNGSLYNRSCQVLGYADDIAILGRNKRAIKETLESLVKECEKVGLEINENKTKYLVVSCKQNRIEESFNFERYNFEKVENYIYLGTEISDDNNISNEIMRRIMAGNRAYYAVINLFKSSLLTRKIKLKLYKSLIRPVVCYGAETWTLKTSDIKALRVFERKILRKIYGPICIEGYWRIRKNRELYDLLGPEDIIRFVKARRISWLGHLERLSEERMPKKIVHSKFVGKRKRGRPRKRWIDDVEEDLSKMNIVNWRRKAQDRDAWRNIVKEAKVHQGL